MSYAMAAIGHQETEQYLSARSVNYSRPTQAEAEATEAEYDRLRGLAHAAGSRRAQLSQRSQAAYNSGDGATAKSLSNQARAEAAEMDKWNRAASEFIYRAHNGAGMMPEDTVDLHGQYAAEVGEIVRGKLEQARREGWPGVHVIVGKGIHSAGHKQKIKPKVEEICGELGVRCWTEENAGVVYCDVSGSGQQSSRPPQQSQHGYVGGQQQHQGGQQGHHGQQQQGGNEELEKLAKKMLPKLLRKLEGCCIVM